MTQDSCDMRDDVLSWDVRITRRWDYGTVSGLPYTGMVPGVRVTVAADFVTDEAARDFEQQVRWLLEAGCQ